MLTSEIHDTDTSVQAWAHLLVDHQPGDITPRVGDRDAALVENVFSEGELAALLEVKECWKRSFDVHAQAAEEEGYGQTHYRKEYRGNLRLITTDESLAEAVWPRIRDSVPEYIDFDGDKWQAVGLNEVSLLSYPENAVTYCC